MNEFVKDACRRELETINITAINQKIARNKKNLSKIKKNIKRLEDLKVKIESQMLELNTFIDGDNSNA